MDKYMCNMVRGEEDCLVVSTAPFEALRVQHVAHCPGVTFVNAVPMSLAGSAFSGQLLWRVMQRRQTFTRVFKFYSAEEERSEWRVQEDWNGFVFPPFLSKHYWTAACGDLLNQIMAALADN